MLSWKKHDLKNYVSRVGFPSRGFVSLGNKMKKKAVWARIRSDKADAFHLLLILKGLVGGEDKRPAPMSDRLAIEAKQRWGP